MLIIRLSKGTNDKKVCNILINEYCFLINNILFYQYK